MLATPTAREASATYTTWLSLNTGSIFTAVCALDVVAPPIISGLLIPRRSISRATKTISSSDGVINPERPMMSQFCSMAVSIILSQGTITPRSTTAKLLHCNTTPTIFFPMSCTSPLTVAIKILPLGFDASVFSASINGCK